ncbi:MAG: helix-turn-helix domain-containing protein [Fimbriimonadaceae bacterium]|nr:helix-turn-helix domain-containing protein [Fimbriimonadaceae bacterium]
MALSIDRIDLSELTPTEVEQLSKLLDERPCLRGREGFEVPLPDPIFHLLLRVVDSMRRRQVIVLLPENETLTTKSAAELLGVSRPHLVGLLKDGKIPYHMVGSHRRVRLSDVRAYQSVRDRQRREALGRLFDQISDDGLYDETGGIEDNVGDD